MARAVLFVAINILFSGIVKGQIYCSDREVAVQCPPVCEPICQYGRSVQNYRCVETGLCGYPCRCRAGFIRDPETWQCWKISYCWMTMWKSKVNFVFDTKFH